MEEAMDWERLEARIERCPLQELRVEMPSGVYWFGHSFEKPAWWSLVHEPAGQVCEMRGLKNIMAVIEQTYPDLYAWLVRFSHGEEDGKSDRYGDWSLVRESGETSEI
jgi:hypothetical protein